MSKIFTTEKGTNIPLMNLKGKDYMMVAYRIQWFTEEVPSFLIETSFSVLDDVQTVAHAVIEILDENGRVVKRAKGTKRETQKDFSDHTEKAETAAIGRALIQLGYGTQFAISDMEEGMRLIDSPLASPSVEKTAQNPKSAEASGPSKDNSLKQEPPKEPAKKSAFTPKSKSPTPPPSNWD